MPVPGTGPFATQAVARALVIATGNINFPTTTPGFDRLGYRFGGLSTLFFFTPPLAAGAVIDLEYELETADDLAFTQNVETVPGSNETVQLAQVGAAGWPGGQWAGFFNLNCFQDARQFVRIRLTPRGSGYATLGTLLAVVNMAGAPFQPEKIQVL